MISICNASFWKILAPLIWVPEAPHQHQEDGPRNQTRGNGRYHGPNTLIPKLWKNLISSCFPNLRADNSTPCRPF